MAARIEFEKEWLPKLKSTTPPPPKSTTSAKKKALSSVSSSGLKNMLDNL
jgi:hypothetical protein